MQTGISFDTAPVTFGAYFSEQIQNWKTLFPAERSYFERLAKLLAEAPPQFFQPLEALEKKMGVTPRNWPRGQFTLEQTDFLNRNPHYAEWRQLIAGMYSRIDPMLDARIVPERRLIVVVAPRELPVGPDRLWLRLQDQGRRIPLRIPDDPAEFVPLLFGDLADRTARLRGPYASWTVDAASSLASQAGASVVRLSYERLLPYRTRLMREIEKVTQDERIRGPRELGARLKTLKPVASEGELATDPILAEFVRATLLNGNGTLLLNNTFVEWASLQALRRARPHLLAIGFGIRNKLKPFSSLLLYADQDKTTPIPTQSDMLGSYVDLEIFYQYILGEARKHPEYRSQTAVVFVAEGVDQLLVIAPEEFQGSFDKAPDLAALQRRLADWLEIPE